MINNTILSVQNLTKKFKKFKALDDVSFEVKKGSFHAFIGVNGSGKTTTIKCIIDSIYNYQGQIYIDGISNKNPNSKMKLGYVPEKTNFPNSLSANDYLMYLSLLNNNNQSAIQQKIDYFLDKFNIKELKNKNPNNFSSGQKKKILLIQALINDPQIIILDEPAANLDPYARYELFEILKDLQKENKTILISSHILSEVNKYCDSLTLINNSKILYTGDKYKNLEDIFYEKVIKNS
ncbi:ABC transporter ATP-binding protein [Mycoplasmopsis ciconiae]|uniref:ABC transporter ATP-binding protein n=1 Tax=Mycoplasmopsis ciconiae TaxID=561067 RepID=A0ABU7MLQ2_9BACT|nr:ABC transporter ATP-binding protein [Mycoplasmopsis ciconiae]